MEGKFRPRVDCSGATLGESRKECWIKTKQSGRVIFRLDEPGIQGMKCFEIAFVSCSEHCDLCFSRVNVILQVNNIPYLSGLLLVYVTL